MFVSAVLPSIGNKISQSLSSSPCGRTDGCIKHPEKDGGNDTVAEVTTLLKF